MSEADAFLIERCDSSSSQEGAWVSNDEWIARLSATGAFRQEALERLNALMVRAARHRVGRMPAAAALGAARRDEIIQSAANEATMSVLARLGTFQGRSRFTTWAYKFAILQAGVEVRRAAWSAREVQLSEMPELSATDPPSPEDRVHGRDLARAVGDGLREVLTPHQRRVALAILFDEVPIDVLADRLGTTRGALYKTLHEARQRLRNYLSTHGYLPLVKEAMP